MKKRHRYKIRLSWLKSRRDYLLISAGKPEIPGSSDAAFGGNSARWNPEDLLVASLSACHKLWYFGLAAGAGLKILAYEDDAEGVMIENVTGGAGQFETVTLRPNVTLPAGADESLALALHAAAHENCFIARSVNFPVIVLPSINILEPDR